MEEKLQEVLEELRLIKWLLAVYFIEDNIADVRYAIRFESSHQITQKFCEIIANALDELRREFQERKQGLQ